MSSPRIGEELERAISGKKDEEIDGLERRLTILSYISRNPCSTSSEIAKAMKISDRGVLWHLRSMERIGIVGNANIYGKSRFFIKGCVREGDCEIFSLIREPRVKKVFLTIFENAGITQKELSKSLRLSRQSTAKILKKLMAAGIITAIRDGKNMRYYPTKKLTELHDIYEKRMKKSSDRIKEMAMSLNIKYEITMDRGGFLYMKIGNKDVRFSTDPLKSTLEE